MTKTDKFVREAIEKMMEMAGKQKTYDEVLEYSKDHPDWFREQSWDISTEEEFKAWFISTIRKQKIVRSKKQAEKEYSYFNLMWGPVLT